MGEKKHPWYQEDHIKNLHEREKYKEMNEAWRLLHIISFHYVAAQAGFWS